MMADRAGRPSPKPNTQCVLDAGATSSYFQFALRAKEVQTYPHPEVIHPASGVDNFPRALVCHGDTARARGMDMFARFSPPVRSGLTNKTFCARLSSGRTRCRVWLLLVACLRINSRWSSMLRDFVLLNLNDFVVTKNLFHGITHHAALLQGKTARPF